MRSLFYLSLSLSLSLSISLLLLVLGVSVKDKEVVAIEQGGQVTEQTHAYTQSTDHSESSLALASEQGPSEVVAAWIEQIGEGNVKVIHTAEEAIREIDLPKQYKACPEAPKWDPTCTAPVGDELSCKPLVPIGSLGTRFFHGTLDKIHPNKFFDAEGKTNVRFDVAGDVCIGPAFYLGTDEQWWNSIGYLMGDKKVMLEFTMDDRCLGAVVDRAAWRALKNHQRPIPGAHWVMLNWLANWKGFPEDAMELRMLPASEQCNLAISKVYILEYTNRREDGKWVKKQQESQQASCPNQTKTWPSIQSDICGEESRYRCGDWEGNEMGCCYVTHVNDQPQCYPDFSPA